MSKEHYIAAHEREVEEYMDQHPNADWLEAYDLTADRAWDRMRDEIADGIDRARQAAKDAQL